MARIAQVDRTAPGQGPGPVRPERVGRTQSNMSTPSFDRAHDVSGFSNSHQITRTRVRKLARQSFEDLEHLKLRFPDGQTSNGIPVETDPDQRLDTFFAQVSVNASPVVFRTARGPVCLRMRPGTASPQRIESCMLVSASSLLAGKGSAFIEAHDDVGSELVLDFHRSLRRKPVPGSVDMRPEIDPAFVQRSQTPPGS